jgi:hypothetical protein
MIPREGARKWKFTFRKGELAIETFCESDGDGGTFVAMPMQEDFDEITKVLREKVGREACAEGTYAIRPGRRAKISWRIVSPTH